ncbi:DUF881 domain-containing protein [Eubacterium barkeri]|uniref:Uncharacterized conserved protein YlxW, UPF0749 family n=1 Tax=Eubacterium barkeri TaxID=1528 RepID=A0A1H3EED7_EUBBA|nr:DUF881 domain-containing protein [Eubacterium barkeri]SDX77071.1 Uncharacterized conserved protein YlxW, UPF0749 family [Eubacterium barkeri]
MPPNKYLKPRELGLLVLFTLIGALMAIMVRNLDSVSFTLGDGLHSTASLYEQEVILENLRTRSAILEQQMTKQQERIALYEGAYDVPSKSADENRTASLEAYLNETTQTLQILDGSLAIQGQGVRVTLMDSDREIQKGENPNQFLVHNSDVLQVLNELRVAGAEGIALNGFRVTEHSTVNCGGAVINVDGNLSTPPFVIEAIGDSEKLSLYLNSDESVIQILKYSEIKVNIEKSESLYLDKSSYY